MTPSLRFLASTLALGLLTYIHTQAEPSSRPAPYAPHGSIERYSPEFDELVAPGAQMETIAEGFSWSEGPLWDTKRNRLLFNDVPENTTYAWSEEEGLDVFIRPSGHPELKPEGLREPGANGLAFSPEGQLVLCQHGNKQIALYDEATRSFTPLADHYGQRKFYSPNDLVYAANGDLYFTDPPYGLPREKQREIDTHYVYLLRTDGTVEQLIDSIPYPNGIGLSPDGSTLYLASSHPFSPALYAFELDSRGTPTGSPKVLFDATAYRSENRYGGCDGIAIDSRGNIWSTGPGGVYVIKPDGELIGFLQTEGLLANCAFGGPKGTTLYITAGKQLLRLETKITGFTQFPVE